MARKAEIVDLLTEDKVGLNGALFEPDAGKNGPGLDAWLLIPGTMGTFYSAVQRPFALDLCEAGYAALTLNTRGHSMMWRNRPDGRMCGFAFEITSEGVYDIRAGIELLNQRGYKRVGLLGHSLGAIKSIYYLSENPDDNGIAAYAGISPPRMARSRFSGTPQAAEFEANLAEANRLVAEGKGMDPVTFSYPQGPALFAPAAFIDKYGGEKYDTVPRMAKIKTPMILTRGSKEPEIMPDGYLEDLMTLAVNSPIRKAITVDGADHFYTGGFHKGAIAGILSFLEELG